MNRQTTPRRTGRRTLALGLAAGIAAVASWVAGPVDARSQLQTWASDLARLRAETDALDTQLRAERTRGLTELRTLMQRRGELQLELDRAGIRASTARQSLKEVKQRLAQTRQKRQRLVPVLEQSLTRLRGVVAQGLPFRQKERLRVLDELLVKLKAGRIEPETAMSRVWRFLEDELKLTGDVQRTRLPLRLSDKEGASRRLVDVVRLGMVTLFTKTKDGQVGQVRRVGPGDWRHRWLTRSDHKREVRRLFEALGKNLTEGAYRLPLPPVIRSPKTKGTGAP